MNGNCAVAVAGKQGGAGNTLDEAEQQRLIRAIESAIEVRCRDELHAWMRGPFHALLPYDSLVCVELAGCDAARQIACLHHTLIDAVAMEFLDHARRGLAARLALAYRGNRRQTSTLDSAALRELLQADSALRTDSAPVERGLVHNAVIHRILLRSGVNYCIVLINLPADRLDRCRRLFKLLSLHLKMALSRALAAQEPKTAALLTERELEILHCMSEGKSNREISAILDISALTLKNHVSKIYRKLDVQNRADAVARGLAAQVGLLPGRP